MYFAVCHFKKPISVIGQCDWRTYTDDGDGVELARQAIVGGGCHVGGHGPEGSLSRLIIGIKHNM